ncbi:MAG: hypothetical protein Q9214_001649 [Letrouitia sp. 1 TL-2023]
MEAPLAAQFGQERTAVEQLQLASAASQSPPQEPSNNTHQPQSDPNDTPDSAKAPRRRNKPSLSCQACTNKKTKCDRGRPRCLACLKRRESHRALGIDTPRKKPKQTSTASSSGPVSNGQNGSKSVERRPSRSSTGSSPKLLSNVPFSHPTMSNLFKAEHPFSNYWTHQGGLQEVIGVLPSREQADMYVQLSSLIISTCLIAKYFDSVDPVYPMIHRESFERDYSYFWSLGPSERNTSDGSLVALIFVMLAMGTQFVELPSLEEKEQTAEFYVSASHQALRMFSYLGRPSMRSIQTMVLITYFLMNDNHASDAWAFAGVLIRQAYALGLNRDPSLIVPNASAPEKQQRRKVWQAVFLQDTFLTVILKLPPSATHTDVRPEGLTESDDPLADNGANDTSFIRSMWTLAEKVQETVCTPRALDQPICQSLTDRTRMVSSFSRIYKSFPLPFRTFNETSICELARRSRRLARQTLFLTSNYFHCLMLIHADEHDDMECDVKGTLEAAHEAVNSFFLFHTLFDGEAGVWFHFQHRAFSEALVIAELVKNKPPGSAAMDPLYLNAKTDVVKMVGILQLSSDHDIVARTRVSVLSKYL